MFWRPNILRTSSSHNVQNNSLYRSSVSIVMQCLLQKYNFSQTRAFQVIKAILNDDVQETFIVHCEIT